MKNDKRRAFRDVREDYIIEQSFIKQHWWKLMVTFTFLGISINFLR